MFTRIHKHIYKYTQKCLQDKGDAALGHASNGQRFNYLFYVDFVGTLSDVRCQNALRHLQVWECCMFV